MTEVGRIPKDWEIKTLEELFNSYSTASFSRDQMNADNDVFCIHYGDIHTKYGHVVELGKDATPMISTQQAGRFMRLNDGDIILADASEDYEGVGKAIVVLTQGSPSISGLHTILLRKKNENEFSTTFPTYMFAGRIVKQQIEQLSEGTKINSISFKKIKDVLAVYPQSPSEQRRIAQVLSDTDSLIASLSRTIEKKRLVKQGAMQQLLTGKTRLKGFSGEWVEKELGEVCKIQRGSILKSSDYCYGPIPVIAGGMTPAGYHNVANREGRTITISASGANAGYVSIHNGKIFASDCSTISESNEYNIDFIYQFLLVIQQEIYRAQTGGAQPHIHPKDVAPMKIKMPDYNEQFAISERLRTMDNEIASLEAELQKYKALKQGMMQKLLTGQIRLV